MLQQGKQKAAFFLKSESVETLIAGEGCLEMPEKEPTALILCQSLPLLQIQG